MLPRILLSAACAALLAVSPAAADTTTILGPPAKSPVTIPGSGLKRGERLSGGQQLVRRLTEVRAGDTRIVTLRCPSGTTHAGLGVFERANKVGFAVVGGGSYVGRRSARIRVFSASRETPRGTLVRSSIFALCEPS